MSELVIFNFMMLIFGIVGVGVFIVLFFVAAPYGQHIRKGWGPNLNNKLGWFLMEIPTVLIFLVLYFIGDRITSMVSILFLLIINFPPNSHRDFLLHLKLNYFYI